MGVACVARLHAPDNASLLRVPAGLDRHRPVPESNPLEAAKVLLGRRLFFDTMLSADRSLACASCHDPARAFSDGRQVSEGVHGRRGRRNVPTLVNRAYGRAFFWDGRVTNLEEQVLAPIQDTLELGLALDTAVARLRGDPVYDVAFRRVFRETPTAANLAAALATYVRTILSGNSRFDRWTTRQDTNALTTEEQFGLALFRGKANCAACHVGPTFTDEDFHNTGVAVRRQSFADSGRYLITRQALDMGAFKTPTLRDVDRTAPYMHDGSVATLRDVVAFYDRGGNSNRLLDPRIHPLGLSQQEKEALIAFLRSLNGQTAP